MHSWPSKYRLQFVRWLNLQYFHCLIIMWPLGAPVCRMLLSSVWKTDRSYLEVNEWTAATGDERGRHVGRPSEWNKGEVVWANQWGEKLVLILLDLSPSMSTWSSSLQKRVFPVCLRSSRIYLIPSSTVHLMKDIMVWVGWTTVSRPFRGTDSKSFIFLTLICCKSWFISLKGCSHGAIKCLFFGCWKFNVLSCVLIVLLRSHPRAKPLN